MSDLALHVVSETATTITLGWTPPASCRGYIFRANGKRSSTLDPTRSSVKFAKPGPYEVEALGTLASGQYPAPAPARPASWSNGPQQGAMVPDGVWLGENWGKANMGATWADEQAGILAREQAMGRKFDFIHTQYDRSGWNPPSVDKLGWIHAHGSAAVVSWSPPYSITGVNLGAADGMLAQAARHFENYPFPVMLRLWWEFDNTAGFPWACGYTADIGANFIKAWQRAVNLMHPLAPNLGFWWCPCEGSDRAGVNKSYPGDTYVDWVGSDIYNKGDRDLSQYSTPLHAGWATFEECAMYGPQSQYALWSGRKPFVVGELGCRDDTRKADWFRQIPGALAKAPNLAGLSMFDQDITALEGDNWMVDFGPGDPLAGFVDMAKALA